MAPSASSSARVALRRARTLSVEASVVSDAVSVAAFSEAAFSEVSPAGTSTGSCSEYSSSSCSRVKPVTRRARSASACTRSCTRAASVWVRASRVSAAACAACKSCTSSFVPVRPSWAFFRAPLISCSCCSRSPTCSASTSPRRWARRSMVAAGACSPVPAR